MSSETRATETQALRTALAKLRSYIPENSFASDVLDEAGSALLAAEQQTTALREALTTIRNKPHSVAVIRQIADAALSAQPEAPATVTAPEEIIEIDEDGVVAGHTLAARIPRRAPVTAEATAGTPMLGAPGGWTAAQGAAPQVDCGVPSGLGSPAWFSCVRPEGHDGAHRSQSGHEWITPPSQGRCVHGTHWSQECRACGIWRQYPQQSGAQGPSDLEIRQAIGRVTQGPAERTVSAAEIRALSEQYQRCIDDDAATSEMSRHGNAVLRRVVADLDRLLSGETRTEPQPQDQATRVDGPGVSDRLGTAGLDAKGAER